jgi:hypothetical protein
VPCPASSLLGSFAVGGNGLIRPRGTKGGTNPQGALVPCRASPRTRVRTARGTRRATVLNAGTACDRIGLRRSTHACAPHGGRRLRSNRRGCLCSRGTERPPPIRVRGQLSASRGGSSRPGTDVDHPRGARAGIKRRRHLDDRALHVGAARRVANALFRELPSQLATREFVPSADEGAD